MTALGADFLIDLFDTASAAVRRAVAEIEPERKRDRTARAGQYALDIVADEAACEVLERAPVRIVSEESGERGDPDAAVTVVIDPVDGSTNCARGVAYWATSICAIDGDGMLASLVVNQATSQRTSAVRGEGAFRDGMTLRASPVTKVEDAVVALAGMPARSLAWKQWRALGCASLALCEVAAGGIDGYVDASAMHAPWDYLGAMLACVEAGADVRSVNGDDLVTADAAARRQVVAAGTRELAQVLMGATEPA